jgi:hypothetical protein
MGYHLDNARFLFLIASKYLNYRYKIMYKFTFFIDNYFDLL